MFFDGQKVRLSTSDVTVIGVLDHDFYGLPGRRKGRTRLPPTAVLAFLFAPDAKKDV